MMKKYNYILLALILLIPGLVLPNPAYSQSPTKSELEEIKQMMIELKKDNERKAKEIEEMRKQNAEQIQALEEKINELSIEKAREPILAKPKPPKTEQEYKEEFYSDPDKYSDKYSFFDKVNSGEKPYKLLYSKGPFSLQWSGYADLLVSWFDHGPDQTRPGGAEPNSRLVFDLVRFVLELEGEMWADIGFEVEIEFEHGGTGATLEREFEEFGEIEAEVENGGEVIIEELYVWKKFSDWGKLKAGRFYLAFGLIQYLVKPTNYLAPRRPEAELSIIPGIWDEIGVSFQYYVNKNLDITFQVVNGLDSSFFGSLGFIREGQQGKFELIEADGLALVGRVDYKFPEFGWLIGTSAYYGFNTNANRPLEDLKGVDSPLLLLDIHTILQHGRWRANAVGIYGHLWNAQEISERNSRLPNSLGAPRTPVSDQAVAAWGEVGYNINTFVGLDYLHRLEPFARVDYYDTVYNPRETVFDNPRFENTLLTGGISYTFANSVFIKMDYGYRIIAADDIRNESTINFAWGFVY